MSNVLEKHLQGYAEMVFELFIERLVDLGLEIFDRRRFCFF